MAGLANSTLAGIRSKVRRLTASPSESALPTSDLDEYINDFISQDFAYSIKLDQMRKVYTIFTTPNVDLYPLNVNEYQGIRDPVYFEGVRGYFYKDRGEFFNVFPRWPAQFTVGTGDGSTTVFNFTVGTAPILPTTVVIGSEDTAGTTIRVVDDGGILAPNGNRTTTGNLLLLDSDQYGDFNPAIPDTSPIQLAGPSNIIGTINYVSGAATITFPVAPAASQPINAWASFYQPSRPWSILFWNNEFTVRPVPDSVYKIELESYMSPAQLLNAASEPTLAQWKNYISYGAAIEILTDRQDMEGVENLTPMFQQQEGIVLERQGVAEIGQRTSTIFSSSGAGYASGWPYGWWF